ncbi:MAG TPA: NAD(P)-dependent oxidoreductase, partial [Methylibium sp.]|nr:NAD(P)-dependent oxidoreductase [Methylibium sp.]
MDKVLVARAVFPEVVEALSAHFEVEANPDDRVYTKAELIERLRGKAGAFTTGSERIDAEVLAACPDLRAVCNMAVGYNNIDVPACTARGIVVTNTPDVLTEEVADVAMGLLISTLREFVKADRYLRSGLWQTQNYPLSVGSLRDRKIGIVGMGRIGQAIG